MKTQKHKNTKTQKHKNTRRLILVVCLITVATILMISVLSDGKNSMDNESGSCEAWYIDNYLIAHALGGIDEKIYTNSLEAFEANYQNGFRVFEVDLSLTADNVLVCQHDWKRYWESVGVSDYEAIPTYETFMSSLFYDYYTPLDLKGLLEIAITYDDIYIITDFKNPWNYVNTITSFKQIIEIVNELNCPEVLDRFIIQIYHYDFLDWVDSIYQFDNYLFTCYEAPKYQCIKSILTLFCKENNIPVITMPKEWIDSDTNWIETADKYGIKIYVHTENEKQNAMCLISKGVYGLYTDFLTEEDVTK